MADGKESELLWRMQIPTQDSATLRIAVNRQKISLLSALNEVLKERRTVEHRRNNLLQTAAMRQHQVQETKNKCEAAWVEKITEAQARGNKFETQCNALREKRDIMHKQLIAAIEGSSPNKVDVPSIRANYKMQACQLQRDIAEMKRRVANAKFRLESETKALQDVNQTVKKLRTEVGAKKMNSLTIRPQTLALLSHAIQCRPARESFRAATVLKSTSRGISPVVAPSNI